MSSSTPLQTNPGLGDSIGVFPYQALVRLIHSGQIKATQPIDDSQIQPASIDLRLGGIAYRVRASFLPGTDNTVRQRIDDPTCLLESCPPLPVAVDQSHDLRHLGRGSPRQAEHDVLDVTKVLIEGCG